MRRLSLWVACASLSLTKVVLSFRSMASRTVQSTLSDPALTDNIRSGLGTVATSASSYAASTNSLIKERAGVDLASKFSELGSAVGGHGEYGGYRTAPISQEGVHHGGAPVRYRDDSDGEGDDFHAVRPSSPRSSILARSDRLILIARS